MKYFIFILGCQYNYYDAKKIAHLLEKMGYLLSAEKEADLIMVLACSVRQKAVDRLYGKIKAWKKLPQKPKIVLSACILPEDKKKLMDKVDLITTTEELLTGQLVNLLISQSVNSSNCLKAKPINQSTNQQINYLPRGESQDTVYVPIMQGCDNFCSYCAVPYSRGREVSRPEKEIVQEVKTLIKQGYKKIVLLGQNVNSWGKKVKTKNEKLKTTTKNLKLKRILFGQLLEKIDQLPGNFTYNFLSANPHDFTDDLVETLARLKKWQRVLHLPMQSGDDEILKKMNRKYSSKQYMNLVYKLKAKSFKLILTTDIIVGFPGETEKQFQNTVNLCQKIGFSKAYISQYSPRPNTFSAREMNDDVPKEEKKRRWVILDNLINRKD